MTFFMFRGHNLADIMAFFDGEASVMHIKVALDMPMLCDYGRWYNITYTRCSGPCLCAVVYITRPCNDVIMNAMSSQTMGVSIVHSTVCLGVYQRKHLSSASLPFVRGIHRWPVNSPHNGPVTQKMLPFGDVSMHYWVNMIDLPIFIKVVYGSKRGSNYFYHW